MVIDNRSGFRVLISVYACEAAEGSGPGACREEVPKKYGRSCRPANVRT